jgi:hypothetical protein
MSFNSHALNQLVERIREEGESVFATPEDADFFRKNWKQKPASAPAPVKKEIITTELTENTEARSAPKKIIPPAPVVEKVVEKASPPPEIINLSGVRNLLSIVAPELSILNEIPSDAIAKKISERWKTKNQTAPISILSFQEPGPQKVLLEQVAKALDVYFGPVKIVNAEGIEKEKQWETFLSVPELKWIIVCDYSLWQLQGLMQFYKETPAQGTRMLGNIPIFLLPDLSLYLKDPLLKRSLWRALCQKFS